MDRDENGRVILSTELIIRSLLDDLLKNEVINIATYNKAVKEVEDFGSDK